MSPIASIDTQSTNFRRPRVVLAISADERSAFLESHLDRLKAAAEVVDAFADGRPNLDRLGQLKPEIIVSAWSTPWLEPLLHPTAGRLKYICHLTGSVRNVVPRNFIEQGGLVTNWGPQAHMAVAEHALLLALASLRNMPAWGSYIASPKDVPAPRALGTRTLCGRRVGIHGFGGVAQALVKLLQPFTASISCYSAGVPAEFIRNHGAEPAPSLNHLFSQSEVLFECEASTPATRQSVSAQMLSLLPDEAVFINVARGDLLDEEALVREASSGRIRVALDVITVEPLTPESAVSRIRGAVLSPHIGGPTLDQYRQIGDLAATNIERYAAGAALHAQVTLEVFDRST